MNFESFDAFCSKLNNTECLIDSTLRNELHILKSLTDVIKIDVVKKLLQSDINRDDYLDFFIMQLQGIQSKFCKSHILEVSKWLNKNNITFEQIFKEKIKKKRFFYIYVENSKNFQELLGEKKFLMEYQNKYYIYFCKYLTDDLISFFQNKKIIHIDKPLEFQTIQKTEKIKWIGKPSQLGIIIGQLVEMGYIEAPIKKSGDINYTQFAKTVRTSFDTETTEETLIKYLNFDSEKAQPTIRKFKENGFNIPHKNIVS
ncbi:hypothetical protein [Flavobacterium sp. LB3R33]|uniref:hypothetical protein n=1 Tax=Flavobacterium sp. LB3R33 TaxID=3401721 RepID=UPI003AADD9BA